LIVSNINISIFVHSSFIEEKKKSCGYSNWSAIPVIVIIAKTPTCFRC